MICNTCGKEIPDNSFQCQYCGHDPLEKTIQPLTAAPKALVVFLIVVVILAAVLGFLILQATPRG